jgi:hypothetical protein
MFGEALLQASGSAFVLACRWCRALAVVRIVVARLRRTVVAFAILMEWVERAYVEVDEVLVVLLGDGWSIRCAFVVAGDTTTRSPDMIRPRCRWV